MNSMEANPTGDYPLSLPLRLQSAPHKLVPGMYCLIFGQDQQNHSLPIGDAYIFPDSNVLKLPHGLAPLFQAISNVLHAKDLGFKLVVVHWPNERKPVSLLVGPFVGENDIPCLNQVLNHFKVSTFRRRVFSVDS